MTITVPWNTSTVSPSPENSSPLPPDPVTAVAAIFFDCQVAGTSIVHPSSPVMLLQPVVEPVGVGVGMPPGPPFGGGVCTWSGNVIITGMAVMPLR